MACLRAPTVHSVCFCRFLLSTYYRAPIIAPSGLIHLSGYRSPLSHDTSRSILAESIGLQQYPEMTANLAMEAVHGRVSIREARDNATVVGGRLNLEDMSHCALTSRAICGVSSLSTTVLILTCNDMCAIRGSHLYW